MDTLRVTYCLKKHALKYSIPDLFLPTLEKKKTRVKILDSRCGIFANFENTRQTGVDAIADVK